MWIATLIRQETRNRALIRNTEHILWRVRWTSCSEHTPEMLYLEYCRRGQRFWGALQIRRLGFLILRRFAAKMAHVDKCGALRQMWCMEKKHCAGANIDSAICDLVICHRAANGTTLQSVTSVSDNCQQWTRSTRTFLGVREHLGSIHVLPLHP